MITNLEKNIFFIFLLKKNKNKKKKNKKKKTLSSFKPKILGICDLDIFFFFAILMMKWLLQHAQKLSTTYQQYCWIRVENKYRQVVNNTPPLSKLEAYPIPHQR